MKEVIEKLIIALKDPEYKQGWVANIAMAQLDNERWYREKHNKVGKYLNYKDRHAIANLGAEYFLELLSGTNKSNIDDCIKCDGTGYIYSCTGDNLKCEKCDGSGISDELIKTNLTLDAE